MLSSLAVALCLASPQALAQDSADVLTRLGERWRWRELALPEELTRPFLAAWGAEGELLLGDEQNVHRYLDGHWEEVWALRGCRPWSLCAVGGRVLVRTRDLDLLVLEEGELVDLDLPRAHLPGTFDHRLSSGHLVLLTEEGLIEFDGQRILRRKPAPEGLVLGVQELEDGRWLTLVEDGAFVEDGDTWRELGLPAGRPIPLAASRLFHTPQGLRALPFQLRGPQPIVAFEEERLRLVGQPIGVLDACQLNDGSLLMATTPSGMALYRDDRVEPLGNLLGMDKQVQRLALHPRSGLVALTGAGSVWHCDLESERWSSMDLGLGRESQAVLSLAEASAGGVWVGTSQGIARVEDGRVMEAYLEAGDGTPLQTVTALAEDSQGALWVGSGSGFNGAWVLRDSGWSKAEGPLEGYAVHQIRRGAEGSLWFLLLGSRGVQPGGGMARLREGRWTLHHPGRDVPGPVLMESERCYDLLVRADGDLLVATYKGVLRREGERWLPQEGLPARDLRHLHEAADGTLFAAGGLRDPGLWATRGGQPVEFSSPRLAGLHIGGLAAAPAGGLWISALEGLFLLRDGLLHEPTSEPGLPPWNLFPLHVQPDGSLLLGTLAHGLVRYRPDHGRSPRTLEIHAVGSSEGHLDVRWTSRDPWEATPPEAMQWRLRLEGQDWSPLQGESHALLKDLSSYTGRLQVQAFNTEGNAELDMPWVQYQVPVPLHRRPAFLVPLGLLALVACALLGQVGLQHRSARRRSREELRRLEESEAHYRSLVEGAELMWACATPAGDLTYLSPLLAQRLEGELPAKLGELLARFGTTAEPFLAALEDPAKPSTTGELVRQRPDGSEWILQASLSPSGGGEQQERVDLIALDVTAEHQGQRERAALAEQLRHAQKLEAVGQLAAGIAHDFNNALTAILGNAELLGMGLKSERDQDYLGQIRQASDHAAGLTRQLLAFSRRQVMRMRVLDLNQVAGTASALHLRLLPESIELVERYAPDPLPVECDSDQLTQVLSNLVINARDAMPAGGRIFLETRREEPDAEQLAAMGGAPPPAIACLEVRDEGQGMSPDTLERAFEPFFTTKEEGRGTGLGLSTVHGIVQQMGGSIRLRSQLGMGTSVQVRLPLLQGPEQARAKHALEDLSRPRTALPQGQPALSGTVLLCEDQPSVRQLVRRSLQSVGLRVLDTDHPDRALDLLENLEGPLHLLLTDVILPSRSGRNLAEEVQLLRPGVPVLYMSGYSTEVLTSHGRLEPSVQLLAKPFTPEELLEQVQQALGIRAPLRS